MNAKKIERWLFYATVSVYGNLALAVVKLAAGIYSVSFFLCVHALYNAGIAWAKHVAVRGCKAGKQQPDAMNPYGYGRREYRCYKNAGMILTASSAIFIIYCLKLFLFGSWQYDLKEAAIAIAAVTFTEIGMALYGVILARKGKEPAISAIKLTNLASSLISLVLTQSVLLSFATDGDYSHYNGLSGLIFGGCALAIGLFMTIHMSRVMNGKNHPSVFRKVARMIRSSGCQIHIIPVQYEDYGPRMKLLYVRVKGTLKIEEYEAFRERLRSTMHIELRVVGDS